MRRLLQRTQRTLPVRVITAFGESQASNYAAALAFAAFLAMFPMMLGALSIIGLAIRDPVTEARFQSFILQMFPGNAQPALQHAVSGMDGPGFAGWPCVERERHLRHDGVRSDSDLWDEAARHASPEAHGV